MTGGSSGDHPAMTAIFMRWFILVLCCFGLGAVQAAVVATDDFNRADGELGANWSRPIGSEGNLVITNQQVGVGVENAHCFAYWSTNSFNDDQYSQATITIIGPWTGVSVRTDAVQDLFYFAFVFGPNDYRIYLRWDGEYYSLATGSSETWQVGDTLRLEVSGSQTPVTVTMYRNGKPVLLWVSTSSDPVKTGGSPGVGIYSRTGAHLTLDNFEGGNLDLDTNAPTVPQGLTLTGTIFGQLSLSWIASTDDVAVAGYVIERCDGGDCTDFTQVAATSQTNFTDTGLSPVTTYSYRIRATDAAGNLSAYSGVVTGTTGIPVPPSVSVISNQNTSVGVAIGPFPFFVSDPGIDPATLTVTAISSNQALVPDQNLSIVNLGVQRDMTIIPVDGQVGTSTITISVGNGVNSTNTSFVLTINPPGWGESIWSNASSITIPASGGAAPYPSPIAVSGVVGTITNIEVTLHGMSHTVPSDVDMLLVGPDGQGVVLMSATIGSYPISNITFSLSDQASYALPQNSEMAPGTFRPTDYAANHTNTPHVFPPPAPSAPFTTNLSTFNGISPNGTWSLYVSDSGSGVGNIAGGWGMALRTVSPPNLGSITNLSTWVNTATPPIPFTVSDAETPASNLVVTAKSSNQSIVPDSNILLGGVDTNRAVVLTPARDQMGTTLISLIVTDGDEMSVTNTFLLTVDPAPLTVSVDSFSRLYGGTNPLLTGQIAGLQVGDDITVTLSTTATTSSPVGVYPITPVLNDPNGRLVNYTVAFVDGMLSITPTALTIIANDASKGYDGLAYSGGNGVTYAGFVNGDNPGSLTGALSYTGNSQGAINVGSYIITPGGASDPNYSISFVDGTLSVTPALSSVAVSSQPNPSLPGTNVAFTAVVTAVGPVITVPSGFIQFKADNLSLGSAIPLVSGVGTLVTGALTHGSHSVTAEYSGDGNFVGVTNGLPVAQVVNTPPQAGTNSVLGYENVTTQIAASILVASGSDADMDPLTLISVSPASEVGGKLTLLSGTINYSPPTNYIGADSFSYTLTDPYNSVATGIVEMTVKSTEVTLSSLVDLSGGFSIAGSGRPNGTYLVQASSDLVHWSVVGTVTADETGSIQFTDSIATDIQARFYRTVAQ